MHSSKREVGEPDAIDAKDKLFRIAVDLWSQSDFLLVIHVLVFAWVAWTQVMNLSPTTAAALADCIRGYVAKSQPVNEVVITTCMTSSTTGASLTSELSKYMFFALLVFVTTAVMLMSYGLRGFFYQTAFHRYYPTHSDAKSSERNVAFGIYGTVLMAITLYIHAHVRQYLPTDSLLPLFTMGYPALFVFSTYRSRSDAKRVASHAGFDNSAS